MEAIASNDGLDDTIGALGKVADQGTESQIKEIVSKMHFAYTEFAVDLRISGVLDDYSLAAPAAEDMLTVTTELGDACLAID